MNKTLWWILGIIVLLGLGYYIYNVNSGPSASSLQSSAKGNVVVAFTDAAMKIKNVNEIAMNIDKVELYNDSVGWTSLSSDTKRFNLLDLNSKEQIQLYA